MASQFEDNAFREVAQKPGVAENIDFIVDRGNGTTKAYYSGVGSISEGCEQQSEQETT